MTPQWNGAAITHGWWWLLFEDGPGPRHWDGTFWDRGSFFATAEDYANNPILAPCNFPAWRPFPETAPRDREILVRGHWRKDGQTCIVVACWSTIMSDGSGYQWFAGFLTPFSMIEVDFDQWMELPI